MQVKISPSKMGGTIKAIPSKSYAHRILLASMLSKTKTQIEGVSFSKDMEATIGCIKAIGCQVEIIKDKYYITPFNKTKNNIEIDCIESGSTLRFILPILAALNIKCVITGKEGLRNRPIIDLINTLKDNGAIIDGERLPINLERGIKSGEYLIRGDISSQYITGLLMALPILDGDSKIIIEGEKVSTNYLDITIEVLKEFNIEIKEEEYGYFIKGNQEYISPKNIKVQGDWSNAAFWLTLGAINNGIEMTGLTINSAQGDKEILQILLNMGAQISINQDSIKVKKSQLQGIEVDVKNIPDLAPIVSIAMANAIGISQMKNVDRLKIKETDRLAAIEETLKNLGIKHRYMDNELHILGGEINSANLYGFNDHRMVMMESIAASIAKGYITIDGAEAVNKSYPNFFKDYKDLGGICHEK